MDARRRGAPWSAALSALLVISCLLTFSNRASATGADVALNSWSDGAVTRVQWSLGTPYSGTLTNATDGSDATSAGFFGGSDVFPQVAGGYGGYVVGAAWKGTPVNTWSIASVRGKGDIYPAGGFVAYTRFACRDGGTGGSPSLPAYEADGHMLWDAYPAATSQSSFDHTSSGATLADCGITAAGHWLVVWMAIEPTAGYAGRFASFEVTTGAAPVGIEQYCYDMAVGHPQFAWTGICHFRQAFEGTITLTASPAGSFKIGATGNAQYSTTLSLTPIGGFGPGTGGRFTAALDFEQDCYPLCQSDSITIDITDTTHNQHASFAFLRSADGLVQDPSYVPIFTSYSGCYNVTLNQCLHGSAAGTTDITWSWTCNRPSNLVKILGVDTEPNCTGSDATVQIGPMNPTTAGFTATRYAVNTPGQPIGSYTAYALTTNTAQNRIWIIELANPAGTTRGSVTLDFVTGGVTDTYTKPTTGNGGETCAGGDFGCALRNFFNVSTKAVTDLVSGGVNQLRDIALTRQPFNWIVRAFDGVSAQLGRAAAAVTTTSTCTGYVMVLPTSPPVHYNTPTATMTVNTWPTSVPAASFAVLKCADLEPWGGTTWYQNIRAAMDPAIYLGWGLAQLKTLRRGPVAA